MLLGLRDTVKNYELVSRVKLCLVSVFPDIVKDHPQIRNLPKIFLRSFENVAPSLWYRFAGWWLGHPSAVSQTDRCDGWGSRWLVVQQWKRRRRRLSLNESTKELDDESPLIQLTLEVPDHCLTVGYRPPNPAEHLFRARAVVYDAEVWEIRKRRRWRELLHPGIPQLVYYRHSRMTITVLCRLTMIHFHTPPK